MLEAAPGLADWFNESLDVTSMISVEMQSNFEGCAVEQRILSLALSSREHFCHERRPVSLAQVARAHQQQSFAMLSAGSIRRASKQH